MRFLADISFPIPPLGLRLARSIESAERWIHSQVKTNDSDTAISEPTHPFGTRIRFAVLLESMMATKGKCIDDLEEHGGIKSEQ